MSTDDMPLSERIRKSSASRGTNHEARGDANMETREDRKERNDKERDLAEVRTNVAPNRKKKYLPSAPEVQAQMAAENEALDEQAEEILRDVNDELIEELKEQKIKIKDIRTISAYIRAQNIPAKHGRMKWMSKEAGITKECVYACVRKYKPTIAKFQDRLRERLLQMPLYTKVWLARMYDGADIHSQTGSNSAKVLFEMINPRQGFIQNFGTVNQSFGGNQQNITTTPSALLDKTPEELEDEITRLDRGEVIDVEAE